MAFLPLDGTTTYRVGNPTLGGSIVVVTQPAPLLPPLAPPPPRVRLRWWQSLWLILRHPKAAWRGSLVWR